MKKNEIVMLLNELNDSKYDSEVSIRKLDELSEICKGIDDKKILAKIDSVYGTVFWQTGKYKKAEDYSYRGLELSSKLGEKETRNTCLNNLGIIFSILGNTQLAMEYFFDAYFFGVEENDKRATCSSLINITELMTKLGDCTIAKKYLDEAMIIAKEIDYKLGYGIACINNAAFLVNREEYANAKEYIEMAKTILEEFSMDIAFIDIYRLEGQIFKAKGDLNKARGAFNKTLSYIFKTQYSYNYIEVIEEIYFLDKEQFPINEAILRIEQLIDEFDEVNLEAKSDLLIKIALDCTYINNINKAKYYLEKAAKIKEHIKVKTTKDQLFAISNHIKKKMFEKENAKIEKAHLKLQIENRELEHKNKVIERIYDIAKDIIRTEESKDVLKVLNMKLGYLVKGKTFGIWFLSKNEERIDYRLTFENNHFIDEKEEKFDKDKSMTYYAIKKNKLFVTNSLSEKYSRFYSQFNESNNSKKVESVVFVPIDDGERKGVFTVQCEQKNVFDEFDVNVIKMIAAFIELSLANRNKKQKLNRELDLRIKIEEVLKERNRELNVLSYTDSLTSIYNRRYYDEKQIEIFEEALVNDLSFTMVMVDVDSFKEYNDYYGHGMGDRCLVKIANVLMEETVLLTKQDTVMRFGGDEFSIILKGVSYETVELLCKRVILKLREEKIIHAISSISDYVTVSIGVCLDFANNGSLETFITRSDEALLYSKRIGKSKFTIFELNRSRNEK